MKENNYQKKKKKKSYMSVYIYILNILFFIFIMDNNKWKYFTYNFIVMWGK